MFSVKRRRSLSETEVTSRNRDAPVFSGLCSLLLSVQVAVVFKQTSRGLIMSLFPSEIAPNPHAWVRSER